MLLFAFGGPDFGERVFHRAFYSEAPSATVVSCRPSGRCGRGAVVTSWRTALETLQRNQPLDALLPLAAWLLDVPDLAEVVRDVCRRAAADAARLVVHTRTVPFWRLPSACQRAAAGVWLRRLDQVDVYLGYRLGVCQARPPIRTLPMPMAIAVAD